jgi:hypothetical protein
MNIRQPINLIGGGFQHSPSTSGFDTKYITWVKGEQTAPISIYVDYSIKMGTNSSNGVIKNYAWLCESKTINSDLYLWCENNIDFLKLNYIHVFTHDLELSKKSEIFKLVQCSGKSFIDLNDSKIYEKTKLVSMIASNKVLCEEHRYRQKMIGKYSSECDHFGRGFLEIENVVDGLKDYCFSFVFENATYSNMFTEKITNCFMCGTIPIYYGMGNIGDFFNSEGIITLDNKFNINDLSFELYNSKIEAIKENFIKSDTLLVAEDYIYLNYIKNEI